MLLVISTSITQHHFAFQEFLLGFTSGTLFGIFTCQFALSQATQARARAQARTQAQGKDTVDGDRDDFQICNMNSNNAVWLYSDVDPNESSFSRR